MYSQFCFILHLYISYLIMFIKYVFLCLPEVSFFSDLFLDII